MGAWIEIIYKETKFKISRVAPLVGAWIEILYWGNHLFRVWSLPSWERGLKSFYLLSCLECLNVAPLVGAWIEISLVNIMFFYTSVAPLVGAWIEITCAL